MVDPRKHADDRNWFESILRMIPGFHGYLEKEYRRESDLLARGWLASRLEKAKVGVDETMRALVDEGNLTDLPQVERIRALLDKLIGRFRSAPAGYSGLFDFVRVREDLLDKVYEFDMSLMKEVTSVGEQIEALPHQSDGLSASISAIISRLEEVGRLFDKRGEMLAGLAPE